MRAVDWKFRARLLLQTVDPRDVASEDLRARLGGQRRDEPLERARPRARMVGVWKVRRPHEAVGPDVVDDPRGGGLVGIGGDEALLAEVVARSPSEDHEALEPRLRHGIGAIEEGSDPPGAGL